MAAFLILIGYPPLKKAIDLNGLYTHFVVWLTYIILKPSHLVVGIQGSIIHLRGISLDVRFGCNGLEAFLIYSAAVLAFRAPWRHKLVGLIGGFLILQGLNILRIVALGLVGVYLKSYFYYFHTYIAQGIMIVLALIIFLGYLSYVNNKT